MKKENIASAISHLQGANTDIKIQAARLLANLAGDEKMDISNAKDALLESLNHEDESLRASAILALFNATESGMDLQNDIAILKKSLTDSFLGVRFYAMPLFVQLAEKNADLTNAMEELINALSQEEDNQNRTNLSLVFYYLAQNGHDISTALPLLVTTLGIPGATGLFYQNITDAVANFLNHHPKQKEFLRIILDGVPFPKDNEHLQKLYSQLNLNEVLGQIDALDVRARTQYQSGDMLAAMTLLRQGMELAATPLGMEHPYYLRTLSNLCLVLTATGNKDNTNEALTLIKQTFSHIKKFIEQGKKPDLKAFMEIHNLANQAARMNEINLGANMLKIIANFYFQSGGKTQPNYIAALNNLAEYYRANGLHHEAEPLLRKVLGYLTAYMHQEYYQRAIVENNLALLLADTGRPADAIEKMLQAIELKKKALGNGHSALANNYYSLAEIYRELGDSENMDKYNTLAQKLGQ
jgi:tetratricopeptide (TPR) repeat protein